MELPFSGKIIKTKIRPPQRRVGLLRRDRLIDFLHDNVNRKLLLISASPGYGKTSLLIDFVQDTELPTCWYGMDPSDSDPRNFITYLVSSISETFPELGESQLGSQLEVGIHEQDLETLLHSLVNAIQDRISEYFLILIDDFQFAADNETILDLVNWFLDHQPDNCCLVLASRVMPELPYLKLTARQEIAGLGSEDLAFTPEEIQNYLASNHNLQLPLEEAQKLAEETEGWITGILLGTHTLWKGLIRSITAAKARDEQIFDYMAQEIFDQQSEAIKHFLKSTSILNVLTPSFCDELLGISDSETTLDYLEQANLFILHLSGDEKAFRYHALFQDFLYKQFGPQEFEQRSALQRSAGVLRLAESNWERALELFLASRSDEQAIAVIKEHMESVYRSGRLVTLRRWLDALDPDNLAGDTALLIMRGRLYRQAGEFEEALACYETARQLSVEQNDRVSVLSLNIHAALVHQYSGAKKEAKEMAEAVLADAHEQNLEPSMRAQAHRILGEYHHLAGELGMAKREFRQSLKLYQRAGDRYHQSLLLQALGTTARRMGNPLEAEEHYTRAVEILKTLGNRWRMTEVQNNIAVGYYYQGEYEKALEIFQQALKDAREAGHEHTEAIVLISLGDLYADLQNVGRAQDHFQAGLDGARATNDVFLEVYCLCALANLYRVDEAWEHAYSLLDEASELSGEEGSGYLKGLGALARGMVAHDHDQLKQAHSAFQNAITKLSNAGAQRELTRAQIWDANTLFRMERTDEAFTLLASAVKLTREIKHPHLLVVDGAQMTPMLEQAKTSTAIEGLEQLLIRIHKHSLATLRARSRAVSQAASPPALEVLALGADTVKVNGNPIPHTDWKGPLVKELFFYLLENEPVRREIILDVFWPQYSTSKAQSVFHASLYRMRRILPKGLIVYDNKQGAYVIDRSIDTWYDARAFSTLCERATTESNPEGTLEEAVRIYQGEYLPSVYSDWCLERRSVYHNAYIQALSQLAALKYEHGKFDDAASMYQLAVKAEPYQEQLHRGLMQSLSEAGRMREALRHYDRLRAMLKAEMDMPPTQETTALSDKIKEQVKNTG